MFDISLLVALAIPALCMVVFLWRQNRMKKKELEERMNWYRQAWEKSVDNDIKNTEHFLKITKNIQEIIDENKNLGDHNTVMIKLLQAYVRWDPVILETLRKQGIDTPDEGPATTYLREIGALNDGPNRGN
jgi:hypothetical protein